MAGAGGGGRGRGRGRGGQLAFDWVGGAFLSVLSMATPDSWEALLNDGLDAAGPYKGPVRGRNGGAAAFFVLGVFGAYLIMINMFKAVFIELFQYNSARIEAEDRAKQVPRKPARDNLPDVWRVRPPPPRPRPSAGPRSPLSRPSAGPDPALPCREAKEAAREAARVRVCVTRLHRSAAMPSKRCALDVPWTCLGRALDVPRCLLR